MYTDLPTLKLFLWITGTAQDTILNLYLEQTKAILDNLVWPMASSNKTFYISFCEFYDWYTIRLLTRNITAIVSINWTAYTWVLWTDYLILKPYASVLYIKDFNLYVTWSALLPKLPLVVTSGYTAGDSQYKLLGYIQCLMVEWLLSKENWFDVHSYKLWDRSFTFADKRKDDILALNSLIDSTGLFSMLSILPTL